MIKRISKRRQKKSVVAINSKPHGYSRLLSACLLALAGMPPVRAHTLSLPEPENSLAHLTNPALHPGASAATVGEAGATVSSDGHTFVVDQTTSTAIIDWSSFNIPAGYTVIFEQPSSTAVALNEINQGGASQILGALTANGQVYMVNANGFTFGAQSNVQANTVVASSLGISDNAFQQGIANVAAANVPASSIGVISPTAALSGGGAANAEILVEKGAIISAADTGRVILAAPTVENNGSINAPDGQVILVAAADKVYLQESASPDLRGMLVEVQTGGAVKNTGSINTPRGNTTMLGFAVTQQGMISASTSVALNGSVRLLAREGAQLLKSTTNDSSNASNLILEPLPDSTVRSGGGPGALATVTLANGGATSVTLDSSGGDAVSGQAQPKSLVDIEAGYIDMQGGSQIVAHGCQVSLTADLSPTDSNINFPAASTLNPTSNDPSRILLEPGSLIDVSGAQYVDMAMSSNIVNLTLYSYELRNDPTQKNGVLYGQNVFVDSRYGTSLADISGAVAQLQYSVYYRNSNAGTVNLDSEGDVIVQRGAEINISGGALDYLAGIFVTTDLASGGALYTMATASPNLVYQQLVNVSNFQPGYIQGMNAGAVNIKSRDAVLDGTIQAQTVNGEYQRSSSSLAEAGQLSINTDWTKAAQQDVIFQNNQTDTALPAQSVPVTTPLYLSSQLFANGLGGLNLNTGGNLTVTQGTHLNLPELGNLTVSAGSITDDGVISAPAGSVNLSADIYTAAGQNVSTTGQILLAPGGSIDVSGAWVNDLTTVLDQHNLQPVTINGGAITLQAQGNLLLESGSALSANGGAWLQNNLALSDGLGGQISLTTADSQSFQNTQMELNGSLSAYGVNSGGSLSVNANNIAIGGAIAGALSNPDTLYLSSAFLESGGFGSYNLTANLGGLNVAANTNIVLQQTNRQLTSAAFFTPSAANLANLTTAYVWPQNQRQAVDLSLNVLSFSGVEPNQSLSIGQNAVISADPNATISLNSDANISVDGTINAPAGIVNAVIQLPADSTTDPGYNSNQAITLGADAHLNANGATVFIPNSQGLQEGNVLAGGVINLTAQRGYILADSNSSMNVSGTNSVLDITNTQGINLENIASAAGTINLTAAEGMVLQGQLIGNPGNGPGAAGAGSAVAGGSLNIVLNAQQRGEQSFATGFTTGERIIQVSAAPADQLSSQQISSGIVPVNLNGMAYISAVQITQGGFDNLKLETYVNLYSQTSQTPEPQLGAIQFDGDVSLTPKLSLILDAPVITHNWESANDSGQVTLSTDMFTLGSSQNQTALSSPAEPATAYNGSTPAVLTVNAKNIDLLGASVVGGFAQTRLNSAGAINLIGVNPNNQNDLLGGLTLTGELDLSAREIYPATQTQFAINIPASLSPAGLVDILPAAALP
ncbi:MAG: filamentous hemagglutinin N-terminal domain-containing protein [Methylomonas sp.]